MKTRLEFLEKAKLDGTKWTDIDMNMLLAQAYFYSREAENEVPNFGEVIWDDQIEEILADCRRYGIKEFTISSTFSSLITSIAKFEEHGAKLEGIVKINSIHKGWETRKHEVIPAFKMNI